VKIELKEIGMTQYANRYTREPAEGQKTDSDRIMAKLLRRVMK